jgi:AcrR family transcriptional regulator
MKVGTPTGVTRDRLLHAAMQVVKGHGTQALTLDAVAAEAGISKGGLLYHFPNKESLVRGMVQDYLQKCQQQIDLELAREPAGTPGHWLRAYIRARFSEEAVSNDMVMAFNVAIGSDPALMKMILDDMRSTAELALNDGLDETQALLIHMAVEGYYQTNMISGLEIAPALRDKLYSRLLQLTEIG